MNNAKMWLVVSPSVGVPIFLGAVAVGSFAVHVAVLSNTSWVSDFLSGKELGSGEEMAASQITPNAETSKAAYVIDQGNDGRELTVYFADGTTAKAVLKNEAILASAAPPPKIATD
ncbi:light-harvesting protein [Roseobacter sp.]|uniref:light-harvesting protein n=1 Tax=Roseobacter sp. TaxID=1907202 RepID=UPI00385B39D8